MANILKGRGYDAAWIDSLKAQCNNKSFAGCPPAERGKSRQCCCRRVMYEEPDFATAESLLEEVCRERGYSVLFLPKFHCELNPIEQCWGFAKRQYRLLPSSSDETILERNINTVLDDIPLAVIRRFVRRSLRFTDAYEKGLDGCQAAWAAKMYHGHRTCPESLMADMDTAGLLENTDESSDDEV
jgi:hypothetical protein